MSTEETFRAEGGVSVCALKNGLVGIEFETDAAGARAWLFVSPEAARSIAADLLEMATAVESSSS